MSVIHTPRKPEITGRMIAFLATMYSLLSVLFLRLWYFQVVKAPSLVERAEQSRSMPTPELAPRGLIYDRSKHLVAGVKRQIVVNAVPSVLKKHPEVIDRVIQELGADPRKIAARLKDASRRPFVASPIFVGASIRAGTRIAESPDLFPGISVDTLPMRSYADSKIFSHVLGYVWVPSESDRKRIKRQGKDSADYVGKVGVEAAYETELMGIAGAERLEVDAKGRPVRLLERDEPRPGNKLVLTLDTSLQRYATQLMADGKYIGGIVAIDPRNGEVLCMVSSPTFDAQSLQGGITDSEWKAQRSDPTKPFLNRAIGSSYSPGSTFKIVTSLAAYETGLFDPNRKITCNGGYWINHVKVACLGHHGPIDFTHAFEKSCNTYFATLGHDVGVSALRKAALELGLGQKAGLEIQGESSGLVPTEHWLNHRKHPLKWYLGDTINFAIGQGYVRATPLQMCDLAAIVANNGVCYRPHLVKQVINALHDNDVRTVQPTAIYNVSASADFWSKLKSALVGVIEHGTGSSAIIPGIEWGGKTGSTEHGKFEGKNLKTHAWFVGMAPMDNPKIAVCVLIEEGGHGGEVSAPIAGQLVKHYLLDEPKAASKALAASTAKDEVPLSPTASAQR